MNNHKIVKSLGALLIGSVLSLAGVASVAAAENAAGVAEHMGLTLKTTKEALAFAKEGNEKACLDSIKTAKQHYKEVTGDAAGKALQDAIKRLKEAQEECSKEGGAPAAAAILEEVVAAMDKINKGIK